MQYMKEKCWLCIKTQCLQDWDKVNEYLISKQSTCYLQLSWNKEQQQDNYKVCLSKQNKDIFMNMIMWNFNAHHLFLPTPMPHNQNKQHQTLCLILGDSNIVIIVSA